MSDVVRLISLERQLKEYYQNIEDPFATTDIAMGIINEVGWAVKKIRELEQENKRYREGIEVVLKILNDNPIIALDILAAKEELRDLLEGDSDE